MALAKNLKFYMNGVPLGCALQSFDAQSEVETLDATTLCKSSKVYTTGLKTGTVSASGIWDYDQTNADEIHNVFSTAYASGNTGVVFGSLAALATNADCVIFDATQTSYNVEIENGALIMCNADFQSTTGIGYGKVLLAETVVNNTTTNGSQVDKGSSTSNGGIFQIQIQNPSQIAGSCKIQHSTNPSLGWTDITGGSITLSGNKFEGTSVAVTGTVNRYLRAVATASAVGNITFTAAFARR